MKKQISITKTHKYSQLGECSKNTDTVWIVLHGYGMLSEYFIKKFECILNDRSVIIAPEGSNRFYLENNYYRVGASWMTKLDKEKGIVKSECKPVDEVLNKKVLSFSLSSDSPFALNAWPNASCSRRCCWDPDLCGQLYRAEAMVAVEGTQKLQVCVPKCTIR